MDKKRILMNVAWFLSGIGFSTWFFWPVIKLFFEEPFLDALQSVGLGVLCLVLLLIGLSIMIPVVVSLIWFGNFVYSVLVKRHLSYQHRLVYWSCWLVVGCTACVFLTLIWFTRNFLWWMIPHLALDLLFAVPYTAFIVILAGPPICVAFVLAYLLHLVSPVSLDSKKAQITRSEPLPAEETSVLKKPPSSKNKSEIPLEIKIVTTDFYARN